MRYRSGIWYLALLAAAGSAQDAGWNKFVARNGTYSFHYPAGWEVAEQAAGVTISKPATAEEMWVTALAFDRGKTPAELAQPLVTALRAQVPDLRVAQAAGSPGNASFDMVYSREGKTFSGFAIVIKGDSEATWFSYSAPSAGYERAGSVRLLQTMLSTVAAKDASRPPSTPARAGTASTASLIVGNWSSSRDYGSIVDAATGAYRRASAFAEVYILREDGSFRHVTIGSGQVISGVSTQEGNYSVSGNALILHAKTQSWQPDPSHPGQKPAFHDQPLDSTQRFTIQFEDSRTLILNEQPYQYATRLHRFVPGETRK